MLRLTSSVSLGGAALLLVACASTPTPSPASSSAPASASPSSTVSVPPAAHGYPGNAEFSKNITLAAIEPNDGVNPVITAIDSARTSLDIAVYEMDPDYSVLIAAIQRAQKRGVKVRVILSATIYPPNSPNSNPGYAQTMTAMGIDTKLSDPQFSYAHWKMIVIDAGTADARALICDFNLSDGYFGLPSEYPNEGTTRGMAVWDTDPEDVKIIAETFDSDWPPYKDWPESKRANLIWSPSDPSFSPVGNSQRAMIDLIGQATKSLDIYAQELAKPSVLLQPLLDALARGVSMRIVGNDGGINTDAQAELLKAGAKIVVNPLDPSGDKRVMYIHTKSIIADAGTEKAVAYVGSINPFLDMSLQTERELGVFVTEPASVAKIDVTFEQDFASGTAQ